MNGKSACGIPKNIAFMSTTYVPSSSGRLQAYRSPVPTERSDGRCAATGGGCLISVRDYDPAQSRGTKIVPYGVRETPDGRVVVFQVWEFRGQIYDLSMYWVADRGGAECTTHVMRSAYYAIPIDRLLELVTAAGFTGVRRIDRRFFQPLIVGFKT